MRAAMALSRDIYTGSAPETLGQTTCKRVATPNVMLAFLRLVPQCLLSRSCRSSGELCEVGGSTPVDFGYRVGVVPQCGGPAAAVAEASGRIAQVEPGRQQLASRV